MSSQLVQRSASARPQRVESLLQPAPSTLSALDIWAFVLPTVSFVQVIVIGQLIVSELLMVVMLPWLWSAQDRPRISRWFVVIWAGWLLSQVMTDLIRGSAFVDFARGWSAIVFTFTDFAAILVLAGTPRRARLFALGLATSGLLSYFVARSGFAVSDPWKFALAVPIGFGLAACLSGGMGARLRSFAVGVFVVFGVLNFLFGFRSLGGVSLLTAGYLTLSAIASRPKIARPHSLLRVAAALVFLGFAVGGILQIYDTAASQGLLGSSAQIKYLDESGALGVLVGGRSEILVSAQAIIDSPILGHGSWAKDFRYAELLTAQLSSLGYEIGAGPSDVGLIPTHSYLTQAWVWAGILGGAFWLVILVIAVWLLGTLYSFRVTLLPLLVFSTILLLWNIAFSPYGDVARIVACYGIALCLLGLRQARPAETDHPPRHPAIWASRPSRRASWGWRGGDAARTDGHPAPDRAGSKL